MIWRMEDGIWDAKFKVELGYNGRFFYMALDFSSSQLLYEGRERGEIERREK